MIFRPYRLVDLFLLIVLLALTGLAVRSFADNLDNSALLKRRLPGAPVVVAGQYVCYRIQPDQGYDGHIYCRHCDSCKPTFSGPIAFDTYLPRPQ